MIVHLVDGTYELFRHFYGLRRFNKGVDVPYGAVVGVLNTILEMIEGGATHLGVATDHVIESFRNALWAEYKTGEGIEPALWGQFEPLEEALTAMGVVTWPMVELEADDALGSAAAVAAADPAVEQVIICTPDKDLGQCVGGKVVQHDRRKDVLLDADGVRAKFGVLPESIPDWLALVGDSADGFPGIPGFGAKSAAAVLKRYGHITEIPRFAHEWDVPVRGATTLATALEEHRELADLFVVLATLRTDADVGTVDDWEWKGPHAQLQDWADRLDAKRLVERANDLADKRA
jgi:5'-3' exonuclease